MEAGEGHPARMLAAALPAPHGHAAGQRHSQALSTQPPIALAQDIFKQRRGHVRGSLSPRHELNSFTAVATTSSRKPPPAAPTTEMGASFFHLPRKAKAAGALRPTPTPLPRSS